MYLPELLRTPPSDGNRTQLAYYRLKRSIIQLEMAPGVSFTESGVTTQFGFSKTPVREALARLHNDGLVRPFPRLGYVVSPVTLNDTSDLCDMRTILQSEAAGLTARYGLTLEDAERLSGLADELGTDTEDGRLGGSLHKNYEFETIIANGCSNARLAKAVVDVFDEIERVFRLAITLNPAMPRLAIVDRPDCPLERQVVDAIIDRDEERARSVMQARNQLSRRDILESLTMSESVTGVAISMPRAQ